MFQEIRWICKLGLLSLLLMGAVSCTYYAERPSAKNYKTDEPFLKTFYGDYEEVWIAVQKAMGAHRTSVMDREAGYIETVEKAYDEGWKSPGVESIPPSGRRYRIIVRILRGEEGGRRAISVSIKKVILNRVDFFSQDKEEPSDGLEERAILYRVEREYQIAKGLERFYKKQNN